MKDSARQIAFVAYCIAQNWQAIMFPLRPAEDEVDRIDKVLVDARATNLKCALLKMQAVYFSVEMEHDFALMRERYEQ